MDEFEEPNIGEMRCGAFHKGRLVGKCSSNALPCAVN